MNNENIKHFLIYLIAALFLYFSYDILSNTFYHIVYYVINVDYNWLSSNGTQVEAYSLLIMLPIYLCIFVKCSYTKGRLIHSKIKVNRVLACILLVFTVNGISELWFDIANTFLSNVPIFSGSLESFDNAFASLDSESYI